MEVNAANMSPDNGSDSDWFNDYAGFVRLGENYVSGQISVEGFSGTVETTYSNERAEELMRYYNLNPATRDREVMFSRDSAMRLLQKAETINNPALFANDLWSIEYDEGLGQYQANFNEEQAELRSSRVNDPSSGLSPAARSIVRTDQTLPESVDSQVLALNELIDFLVLTHSADSRVAQGNSSPRDLRRAYATGNQDLLNDSQQQ